jgi:catechol 2,3-dioxygenase-like lactoylglutathione lyase family enzyme
MHVHVGVNDLDQSIRFYSTLFGSEPTVTKHDYAKWLLDDPRMNFAISAGQQPTTGVQHLGIQVDNGGELAEVYDRLASAQRPILNEGKTTCCYAKSEKSWIADPDGVVWETFHTTGEATVYGAGPSAQELLAGKEASKCCGPNAADLR